MLLPEGRVTVSLMVPVPVAENPVAPPVAAAVKLSLRMATGKTSEMLTPAAVLGPALCSTIVYVSVPPAATEPVVPKMLEPPRYRLL